MRYNNTIVKGLMVLGFVLMASPRVFAQDIPLLFVEDDESKVEIAVKRFLDDRTNWNVRLAYLNGQRNNAYLSIPFTLSSGIHVTIYVDSFSSATQSSERRLHIYGYFNLNTHLGDRRRDALLEVLNQHTIDDWMIQRLYLDNDGDIAFNWVINIPGKAAPVHAEQVYDAIVRTKFSLDKLVGKLRPLGLP
jgi:hypothetical protein